jgi:AP-1 complex subunit gamma-1
MHGFGESPISQAGNHVRDEVMSSFIRLVCHTVELQADESQESLSLVAVWILGEFGNSILRSPHNVTTTDGSEEVREIMTVTRVSDGWFVNK